MSSSSAKKTPQAPVGEQVEAAVTAGRETVEAAVKAGADMASKGYEKAVAMTQEQVEAAVKAGTELFGNYEDLVAFNKETVDAFVTSGSVWVKGMQDLNRVWFGLAQASMEESVNATRALMGCKTLPDVIKVQSDLGRTNYDKLVSESRKLSDLSVKVAEQTFEPINARVNAAVEKFTQPIAA